MEYDSHFTFALPGGGYNEPCYTYAGRPWEDYSETEKMLAQEMRCHSCGHMIKGVRLRERIQKPVVSAGYTRDSPDRFVFVCYQDWVMPDGSRRLDVTPQYLEAFHAYPEVGEAAEFNKAAQLDFELVGYGLGTRDLCKFLCVATRTHERCKRSSVHQKPEHFFLSKKGEYLTEKRSRSPLDLRSGQ